MREKERTNISFLQDKLGWSLHWLLKYKLQRMTFLPFKNLCLTNKQFKKKYVLYQHQKVWVHFFYMLFNGTLLAVINEGMKREIARVSPPDLNVNIIFMQLSKSNKKKVHLNLFQFAVLFFCHTVQYQNHLTVRFTGPCSAEETQLRKSLRNRRFGLGDFGDCLVLEHLGKLV